jgi:BirA family biotin operon repressor/biotin-[acetyl-CoA-carboxylase] ligase
LKKDLTLELLKTTAGEFLSGEKISKKIGVSRTAVWKYITVLREEGYSIEAMPKFGYRLTDIPDRLYPEEIKDNLSTNSIGKNIYYFKTLQSSNSEARRLAQQGAPHGTLIIAEEQTGGKGRFGRVWFSPKSLGIWASLVLRPEISPENAPPVTMLAAVAVAEAVENITGIALGIKWPNDLLFENKKVCGILTEMNGEMEKVNFLILGLGINVNLGKDDFPKELRDIATSLLIAKKEKISRHKLIKELLWQLEHYLEIWLNSGFEEILTKWKKRCISLNCPVSISNISKELWEGWSEDVDSHGRLIIRLDDGSLRSFISGEVTLGKSNIHG